MAMSVPFTDVASLSEQLRADLETSVTDVVDSGSFILGPQVAAFEQSFAEFCECKHCIGVANGTDALFLALAGLGIGPGDEVITTAFSFTATAQAILRTGAGIKFADIDPYTFNVDPRSIERQINPSTRAIVPVHLYGLPADMDEINSLARKYDLRIIEDAAQAHGATYRGRKVGSLGEAACFSFYPTKNLGAWGDAGAVVTNDDALASRVRALANHGRDGDGKFSSLGCNSRLDSIQAAVLKVKLNFLPRWNQDRRAIARVYDELLSDAPVELPAKPRESTSAYHLYTIKTPGGRRDALRKHLSERGVQTRVYYEETLPQLASKLTEAETCPVSTSEPDHAADATKRVLSLPVCPSLKPEQIRYVADCIVEFFDDYS